jgi:uncharacterized membrane protein required for colicin V production
LTSFDLYVLLIGALSLLFGWVRGGLREAATLLALLGGYAMVAGLATPVSSVLGTGLTGPVLAILLLFLIGFVVVQAALELILRRVLGPKPSRADRVGGLLLGAVRAYLLWGLGWLTVGIYVEGHPLPPSLEEAATRSLGAGAAETLRALGVDEPADEPAAGLPPLDLEE